MSTVEITRRLAEGSPRIRSRFIGAYYLLTIMTGAFVLFFHGRLAFAADFILGVFYLVATAFLYGMSRSANKMNEPARKEDL